MIPDLAHEHEKPIIAAAERLQERESELKDAKTNKEYAEQEIFSAMRAAKLNFFHRNGLTVTIVPGDDKIKVKMRQADDAAVVEKDEE